MDLHRALTYVNIIREEIDGQNIEADAEATMYRSAIQEKVAVKMAAILLS